LTEEVLGDRSIEAFVRSWNLRPSAGGKFELTVNGDLIYSKKQLGRHANEGECKALIIDKLKEIFPEWDAKKFSGDDDN